MLYYDRIDLSKEIDPTKSNTSKECIAFLYWFFDHGFDFQDSVCNVWHNLMMLCLNIIDIATITVKDVDYHCITHGITKFEAIHVLENSVLDDLWVYIKCMSKK